MWKAGTAPLCFMYKAHSKFVDSRSLFGTTSKSPCFWDLHSAYSRIVSLPYRRFSQLGCLDRASITRTGDYFQTISPSSTVFIFLDTWSITSKPHANRVAKDSSVRSLSGNPYLTVANYLPARNAFNFVPVASISQMRLSNPRPSECHEGLYKKGPHWNQVTVPEPGSWVCHGGGARPRKPRVWKTKTKKGSIAKSVKLLDLVSKLSNVKEEVYGALDAWIAWDLDFPLIAVKKCLKELQEMGEWRRIIQISKWMLEKGQGKTLATYFLLLQALDYEGRLEEAEVLWAKVFTENMECIPRTMFGRVIEMYERHGKPNKLIQVFADMEELGVKPDAKTVKRVSGLYSKLGYPEMGAAVLAKYPQDTTEYRYIKGKRVKMRPQKYYAPAGNVGEAQNGRSLLDKDGIGDHPNKENEEQEEFREDESL